MVTHEPCMKPFAAEAVLQHQISGGKRVELAVRIGDHFYTMVVSGNALYLYGVDGELIETYLV